MKGIIFIMMFLGSIYNSLARDYFVGGSGASDNNPGTAEQPFATIQKAASLAVSGDVVNIRSGTYRETIIPVNSGTVYRPDQGASVIISGLNVMDNAGWSVHKGSIYKKTITLPVNGFNTSTTRIENNTTIFANQIFKDGEMMFEARWPKINTFADLLDRSKFRQRSGMVTWEPGFLQDNGLPLPAPGLQGATLVSNGWFITETRTITSHSGNQLNHANIWDNTMTGKWSRQRYYVTGKLALLTQAKEWHYENGTFYFWQNDGGSPSGTIEYKARNWGFDLRGKSNITLVGLKFIGCDPMVGNAASTNTVIDNIRATYMNHHVRHDVVEWQGVGMSKMFGIKLIGANSIIKNSELHSSGSSGVWLGANCKAENNLMHDMGYVGFWANPISLWDRDGGQVITKNTIYRTGRSCFDFGYNWNGQHLNVEISYNDFSQWGLISQDVGATYAWGQCNLTGLNYHHNWMHDTGAPDAPEVGANVAIYFDQSTGPGIIHHNVTWNCGAADMYHETMNETRHSGAQMNIYNNTFANIGGSYPRSYITYRVSPLDTQKNNIYRSQLIFGAGSVGNVANALRPETNPQFIGTGTSGLAYRVKAGSAAINTGAVIPGITDGSVGTPDIGAYEFGGPDWIPGYKQVGSPTGPTVPANVPVASISIAPANVTIQTGATSQLSKTISPSNATNQTVLWTTSNASVATVNTSGLVSAIAAGNATITGTTQDGSFRATSAITVNASPSGLSITGIDNAVLGTGTNQHNYSGAQWGHGATQVKFLNSTHSFSNTANNAVTLSFVGNKVEWYTEKYMHHGIAAVSIDNGAEVNVDLYSATPGQQLLVYTSPALTQGTHTFKIRVTGTKNPASTGFYTVHDFVKVYSGSVAATGIAVSPATSTLTMGSTTTLNLTKTISPSNATNQTVLWSTSNAGVATVNTSGLVSAISAGIATITGTTQDGAFKATSAITVNASPPISSVTGIDNAVLGTGTNQHNYLGAQWGHGTAQVKFLNSTHSYSNTTNNSVTLSFVGNKIEWYTEKYMHHGIAAVSIDNGAEVNVDLYSATPGQQLLVYTSPALTQGTHTFKIRVTGTKNPASTGFYLVHDFVKVYSSGGGGGGGAGVAATSISMEEEAKEVQAYPNPVTSGDILHLELPEAIGALKISDMMGNSKYTSPVTEMSLQISTAEWKDGMYLVTYMSSKGMKTKKIVIQ